MTNGTLEKTALDKELIRAAKENNIKVVEDLLRRGANVNIKSPNGPDGMTPLHVAAFWNNVEIVSLLISAGARVDATTHGGWTVLMYSAFKGHRDVARLLLDNGADITPVCPAPSKYEGFSALNMAECRNETEIAQMLREAAELQRRRAEEVRIAREKAHASVVENQERLKRLSVRPIIIRGMKP